MLFYGKHVYYWLANTELFNVGIVSDKFINFYKSYSDFININFYIMDNKGNFISDINNEDVKNIEMMMPTIQYCIENKLLDGTTYHRTIPLTIDFTNNIVKSKYKLIFS